MKKLPYFFESIVWQYSGPNGWHFVTLPQDLSEEIRSHLKEEEQGYSFVWDGFANSIQWSSQLVPSFLTLPTK